MSGRFRFEGRTAVITGAASGIGAALAEALANKGCHLALADINGTALSQVAAKLKSPVQRLTDSVLDVTDPASVAAFAEEVRETHGEAHLLYNNAGIGAGGPFDRVAPETFDRVMDVNFNGVVRMTRAFLPLMREADQAALVNISSIFGVIAPAGQTAYSASKFAVRGFTMALRHELEGTSVSVSTVHPGGVNTSIADSAIIPEDATNEEVARGRELAAKNLVMPPPQAAEIILKGVERKKPRIFVGRDAHALAWMERLRPTGYWRMLARRLDETGE
jgi:NAD(P)-dependent dehydrogenase (short-subunit alcohol dehydrogenase family)